MTDARDSETMQARWDERYRTQGYVWGLEPNVFVAELTEDLPPGTALDLGCGQGRNAIWLARRGHEVTGIDLSPVAIEQARRLAAEAGVDVEFHAEDLTGWDPGDRRWDLVVLSYLQLPEAARRRVHAMAAKAVAPGGRLVLVAHHLDNLEHGIGGPPLPDVLYTEEQIRGDFPNLEIERLGPAIRHVTKDGVEGDAIDLVFVGHRPAVTPDRSGAPASSG